MKMIESLSLCFSKEMKCKSKEKKAIQSFSYKKVNVASLNILRYQVILEVKKNEKFL